MKQIIFSATNDKGEPLLDFAIRKGEIWTARKSTKLKVGDKVRLIRKYRGKHEAAGVVDEITRLEWQWGHCKPLGFFETYFTYAGFSSGTAWLRAYQDLTGFKEKAGKIIIFIHITNIRRLK